jgi:hypothetical protein
MKSDLLKEAIADAKAVKETALANAKMALEEAFTPKLQSMLSHKIAEELEDEELEEEDEMDIEVPTAEDEMSEDEYGTEDDVTEEEGEGSEEHEAGETAEEEYMEMDSDEEGEEYDVTGEEEESTEEDDLDLESVIAELEAALGDDEEDVVTEEDEDEMTYEEDDEVSTDEEDMDSDEELDINEIIRTLKEMADEEEVTEEETEEEDETAAQLEEAYKTIQSLRTTINEVNLLNAKLLYTNKLFRTFDLNESQKMKVIENFDRTASLREVKLVYATLGENLNVARKPKTVVKESLASKPMKSSAPKREILSEGSEVANRFKKLAGLI